MTAQGHPRILVVDDEPINIRLFADIFDEGFEVFFATDGESALTLARSERPDVILLDVLMPGLDGYEVCRRLKADSATTGIPVIFVTAADKPADEQRGMRAGAAGHLRKPVARAAVLAAVGTQLALHQGAHAWDQSGSRPFAPNKEDAMNQDAPIRILVVDDEMSVVKLLVDIFEDENELLFATEGHKALEIAAAVRPDLILLDVMMPDIDGFEVCRRLKSNPSTRDIPVIFITAHLDPAREIEGLSAGAVDYINKPINAALVHARVKTHLRLTQAMRRVQEFNESLEELVALRTEELKAALESLHRSHEELADSEARATLSTLIASISHELATPLSNSVLTSDMLTSHSDKLLSEVETGQLKRADLASFLSDLRRGTDLLRRNLHRARDLLDNFKQVAADQASERHREFDLAATIGEVFATMAPGLRALPYRVVLSIPPGIVMHSFPGPLGQIVINLINNAYLHGFDGRDEGVVTIRAGQESDDVWIHIEDDGVGIPAANLSRIFEPFFTTRAGVGGTGLGMVIVRNLVQKSLGGSLDVHSSVGIGTTVKIRAPRILPLAA